VQHLPDRVQKLNTYPAPETVKDLRSFLGFANYFRPFVPRFAVHEAQLRQLPDRNFLYTEADKAAFEHLRSAVSSTSILATFDAALPIQLHVDASGDGLGAVLCQVHPKNNIRVVAYASRLLSQVERRYSNTERELLAIEWAVCDRFRLQLTGHRFEVHTDHSALVHECRLKQPTSRIHRMLLKLDAFDCQIVYKPGRCNSAADFLSRIPSSSVSLEQSRLVCNINLERKRVPAQDRRQLITDYHVTALQHFGYKKTYGAISQRFFWPGMAGDVKKFVQECPTCLQYNTATKPRIPVKPIESSSPHEILNVDVIGPMPVSQGQKFILVAIDHFSKYGFAVPVSHVNGQTVQGFMKQIITDHGKWKSVVTDNAKVFTGKIFSNFLKRSGIEVRHISPRHPEANGAVERFVRTIRQLLRKNSSESNWAQDLSTVIAAYNAAKHSATAVSPVEGFLNKPAKLTIDSSHNVVLSEVRTPSGVEKYRASYAKVADRWIPGTKVWHVPRSSNILKGGDSHFQPTRYGPYAVVGPSLASQQVKVTDGKNEWTLPVWELVIY
jgi:hypothetical protein